MADRLISSVKKRKQDLRQTGFDTGRGAIFSWLWVTMYLTNSAINATLQFVASMPVGSGIVFDFRGRTDKLQVGRLAHVLYARI